MWVCVRGWVHIHTHIYTCVGVCMGVHTRRYTCEAVYMDVQVCARTHTRAFPSLHPALCTSPPSTTAAASAASPFDFTMLCLAFTLSVVTLF